MNSEQKNGTTGGQGRRYDETFKRHAVELSLRGDRGLKAISAELGIAPWTLRSWRKRYGVQVNGVVGSELTSEQKDEEIRRLRADLVRMREREIVLKKSLGILSETPGSGIPRSSP